MSLEEEVCLHDLLESLRRILQLTQDGVLEIVPGEEGELAESSVHQQLGEKLFLPEHVFGILKGLLVSLGGPVKSFEARFVEIRLGAQNQGLNGDKDLTKEETIGDESIASLLVNLHSSPYSPAEWWTSRSTALPELPPRCPVETDTPAHTERGRSKMSV